MLKEMARGCKKNLGKAKNSKTTSSSTELKTEVCFWDDLHRCTSSMPYFYTDLGMADKIPVFSFDTSIFCHRYPRFDASMSSRFQSTLIQCDQTSLREFPSKMANHNIATRSNHTEISIYADFNIIFNC